MSPLWSAAVRLAADRDAAARARAERLRLSG